MNQSVTVHTVGQKTRTENYIKAVAGLCLLAMGGVILAERALPPKIPTEGVVQEVYASEKGRYLYVDITSGPYKDQGIEVEVLAYDQHPKVGANIEFDLRKGYVFGGLYGSTPKIKKPK